MLPNLDEPHAGALTAALAYIHDRYDVLGILVSGTIIRGTPHPASDLDFVVAHPHPWRQRAQRFFDGVPAEMFVNPPFELKRAFRRDAESGRPIMLHMVATGVILHDTGGTMAGLQRLAEEMLAAGPAVAPERLEMQRYAIVSMFEDAADIAVIDPERASAFVTEAILSAARLIFLQGERWIPREKALLSELETLEPALGMAARRALAGGSASERIEAAVPFIRHVAGATGFFEWDSEPQPLEP